MSIGILWPGISPHLKAATAIEYGMIAQLIAIVIIGDLSLLGSKLDKKFEGIAESIPNAGQNGGEPDKTPPNVELGHPQAESIVSGTVFFTIYAWDDQSGIAKIDVEPGDGDWRVLTEPPYSFEINTENMDEGLHVAHITASDKADNLKTIDVPYQVNNTNKDVTPPTIEVITPTPGEQVSKIVQIKFNVTDNVGVKKIHVTPGTGATQYVEVKENNEPYVVEWDTSRAYNALYTIPIVAYDTTGNEAVHNLEVKVENEGGQAPPQYDEY